MAKTIEKRTFPKKLPAARRVAAYARVSSAKDAMHRSLAAQVDYYSNYIRSHPGWQYCGVYADEAVTGTKDSRDGFQRLLTDCRDAKIDMVVTKSISRFARNTVTLLKTVRELKSLGIDVFFEEQNIHTLSSEGELMLSILASFAQAESLSVSENQKWRVRKNFEEGRPWNCTMLGYRYENGRLVIQPDEAATVRRIFREYLDGKGIEAIVKGLRADGVSTRRGGVWKISSIQKILRNYSYTGNLLLQTTYTDDHINKKKMSNEGQFPMYRAEGTHEAIVSTDDFEAVQAEIERRAKKYSRPQKGPVPQYPFTGLILCGHCGKHYRRKKTAAGPVWICSTFNSMGKATCPSKQIPENTLTALTADIDLGTVERIIAEAGNGIRICYRNGTEETRYWKDRSRSESWTDEMRKAAGRKTAERSRHDG